MIEEDGSGGIGMLEETKEGSSPCLQRKCLIGSKEKKGPNLLIREISRTFVALAVFVMIIALVTLAPIFSDRWFLEYSPSQSSPLSSRKTNAFIALATIVNGNDTVRMINRFATDPLYDHISTLLPNWSRMRTSFHDASLLCSADCKLFRRLINPTILAALVWMDGIDLTAKIDTTIIDDHADRDDGRGEPDLV